MRWDGVTLEQRIWEKVTKTDSCWLWTGSMTARPPNGYGRININGKMVSVHRLLWEQAYGPIPVGMCLLHSCDVPACVRLSHLSVGTHADNMADAAAKGRFPHGSKHTLYRQPEKNPGAKLLEAQVRSIRRRFSAGEHQASLAAEFGVRQATISKIVRRYRWAHISNDEAA